MPQGLIRPQSKDFEPGKHSTQFHAQHLKFLGKIKGFEDTMILGIELGTIVSATTSGIPSPG